jgi:hypothetical protein
MTSQLLRGIQQQQRRLQIVAQKNVWMLITTQSVEQTVSHSQTAAMQSALGSTTSNPFRVKMRQPIVSRKQLLMSPKRQ